MQLKLAACVVTLCVPGFLPVELKAVRGHCGAATPLADLWIPVADAISDPSKSQRHLGVTDYSISHFIPVVTSPLSAYSLVTATALSYSLTSTFSSFSRILFCTTNSSTLDIAVTTECSVKTLSKTGYFNQIKSKFFCLAFSSLTCLYPHSSRKKVFCFPPWAPFLPMPRCTLSLLLPLLTQSPRPL